MSKYYIEYQDGFPLFKRSIGWEIVEAESWEKAYEKKSPRFQIRYIYQVNDKAKPSDFQRLIDVREDNRHKEAMVKLKQLVADETTKEIQP